MSHSHLSPQKHSEPEEATVLVIDGEDSLGMEEDLVGVCTEACCIKLKRTYDVRGIEFGMPLVDRRIAKKARFSPPENLEDSIDSDEESYFSAPFDEKIMDATARSTRMDTCLTRSSVASTGTICKNCIQLQMPLEYIKVSEASKMMDLAPFESQYAKASVLDDPIGYFSDGTEMTSEGT